MNIFTPKEILESIIEEQAQHRDHKGIFQDHLVDGELLNYLCATHEYIKSFWEQLHEVDAENLKAAYLKVNDLIEEIESH